MASSREFPLLDASLSVIRTPRTNDKESRDGSVTCSLGSLQFSLPDYVVVAQSSCCRFTMFMLSVHDFPCASASSDPRRISGLGNATKTMRTICEISLFLG